MTAPAAKKPITAPVPARAALDESLTHLDLRVLIKICSHDRLSVSKGGQGCLVSTKAMAQALGVHHTSVATSAGRLTTKGYIRAEKRAEDKRGRSYRVIYNGDDELAVRNAGNAPQPDAKSSLPLEETINEKSFLQNGKVVSPDFEIADNSQCDTSHQYKEGKNAVETGKYSVETARLLRGINYESPSLTAEVLRKLDRDLKFRMNGYQDSVLEEYYEWCGETYEHYFSEDSNIAQWANRLQDELCCIIEERNEDAQLRAGEPW